MAKEHQYMKELLQKPSNKRTEAEMGELINMLKKNHFFKEKKNIK